MKLDELVANYIKLRDRKSQLKKQYDEKVAKVDAVMDKMEAIILKTFQDSGIDSARTDAGTAYISTRSSATVGSREELFQWIQEDFDERSIFLENRVSKVAVEQYKAANDDLPPGVNFRSELVVGVRRA